MTSLEKKQAEISDQIEALREQMRTYMQDAPITDEELEDTIRWWGTNNRYLLIQPDGNIYFDVPGVITYGGSSFKQRPAALAHSKHLPGVRVYDVREKRVIFQDGQEV